MLQAICASKLYKSSKRKDAINAAFDNPINAELVGQLASALGEEYQTSNFLSKKREDVKDTHEDLSEEFASESGNLDNNISSSPSAVSHKSSSDLSNDTVDTETGESSSDGADSNVQDSSESESVSSEPVQESSNISGGTAVLGSFPRSIFKNMRQTSDEIKGMLNFKDSTAGVNRILTKENELWIYYNDDVNLNNVMAEVIELLNASSYIYLEFNRLARSDNAIVFQIDFPDTDNVVSEINTKK